VPGAPAEWVRPAPGPRKEHTPGPALLAPPPCPECTFWLSCWVSVALATGPHAWACPFLKPQRSLGAAPSWSRSAAWAPYFIEAVAQPGLRTSLKPQRSLGAALYWSRSAAWAPHFIEAAAQPGRRALLKPQRSLGAALYWSLSAAWAPHLLWLPACRAMQLPSLLRKADSIQLIPCLDNATASLRGNAQSAASWARKGARTYWPVVRCQSASAHSLVLQKRALSAHTA